MNITQESKKPIYVTVRRYGELCGITRQAAEARIERDEIPTYLKKGFFGKVIDITKYPPEPKKKENGGRKKLKERGITVTLKK